MKRFLLATGAGVAAAAAIAASAASLGSIAGSAIGSGETLAGTCTKDVTLDYTWTWANSGDDTGYLVTQVGVSVPVDDSLACAGAVAGAVLIDDTVSKNPITSLDDTASFGSPATTALIPISPAVLVEDVNEVSVIIESDAP